MRRNLTYVLGLVCMLFVAGSASAASSKQLIHMTVYAETGESAALRALDGQALHASNDALKQAYRIVPEVVGEDVVRFKIYDEYDVATAAPIEVIEARADGQIHQGFRAFFKVAVTSIDTMAVDVGPLEARTVDNNATCCVTCGGWRYCCTPRPGYCCTISTSCNLACRACTPR